VDTEPRESISVRGLKFFGVEDSSCRWHRREGVLEALPIRRGKVKILGTLGGTRKGNKAWERKEMIIVAAIRLDNAV